MMYNSEDKSNVLMVGVSPKRVGGMWTVANTYLNNENFNKCVNLKYIYTNTNGTIVKRIICMLIGYFRIITYLLLKKVDYLHIHMAEKGSAFRKGFVVKIGKLFRKSVIVHLHAGPFMAWYKTLSSKNKSSIKKTLNRSDLVLVLGEYWKTQLEEIIDKERIKVLYNGANIPPKNPYNSDSKNIVFLGMMTKNKGIYDLLEAMKIIDDQLDAEVQLLLCGKDLEGDVLSKISEFKLQHRVKMLGWVEGEKKENIYKNAMIDVLPSYYEGLSMSIIEAMAHGIPIITNNISTMPELVGNSDYLLEPGHINALADGILRLSNDKKYREEISNQLYKRSVDIFSEEKFIDNTLHIYKMLKSSNSI